MLNIVCSSLWIGMSVLYWSMATLEAIPSEQRFAIEPQDQTAIVGSRVTLPCRVINKLGTLQWTRDDFALGTHRNLTEFFRYSMIGSDEEGDFSLAIEPVMLDDDAKYQCQVSSGPNGEAGIRSKYARLVVLVAPDKPQIIQGTKLETTEDNEIKLECVSHNGKPAAEITWVDGQGNVIIKNMPGGQIVYVTEHSPESRLFTAKSVLTFWPKMEHHNTTFTCQAQNTADRTFKSAKIQLFVKYAPKVMMTVVSSTGSQTLIEGLEAKLVCQADANPPVVSFRWFLNDEVKFPKNINEFIIPNVSRSHHNSIVKCEALNTVGKSEDSQTLDIQFGPRFKQKPKSVQTDAGIVVQLTCDVESNPPPDITWIHGRNKIVSRSSNLTLNVSHENTGRYYCQAHVPGFPEIGAEAYVGMNDRPTIQRNNVQYGVVGDVVRLQCSAYSVPLPQKITWSFNGQIIDLLQQDYAILEDPLPEGIQSTLMIRNSRQEHFGKYNCSVSNSYGTDILDIVLKPQKNFPLTLALTVAIGGGITLITLIVIILMCQSKGKKSHPVIDLEAKQIEKQCKELDKCSSISELKLEMRTGSSASNINCEFDYGGDHDSDSIITRVAVPLAGPVSTDQQYSTNQYLFDDFSDPVFLKKVGQNNNSYVTYLNHSHSNITTLANGILPNMTNSAVSSLTTTASLDMRYSAIYCNPYLQIGNHTTALPSSSGSQHLVPPLYTTSNNGPVPQQTSIVVSSKSSSPATSLLSQCLTPASKMAQHIIASENMTQQGTHV